MVDSDRLLAAYRTVFCDLVSEGDDRGGWPGPLSGSAAATALAISALAVVDRHAPTDARGLLTDEEFRAIVLQPPSGPDQ